MGMNHCKGSCDQRKSKALRNIEPAPECPPLPAPRLKKPVPKKTTNTLQEAPKRMRLEGIPPQALDAPQHMTPSTAERHILVMLHSIKLQVQHNTAVLQSLNPSQVVPSTLLEKPDGVDYLPLEDMASLDALEERLIPEVELKKAIIAYLNWCGRGVKRGFKPMKLCKLIVQSTLSNSTEVEAENVIKEWLRLSEDRKKEAQKEGGKKQAGQARRPEVEDLC
ncbi:hypothetical protein EOD39_7110 [Acipenser ruthenus]|uniref:Uncharacterized protein n=1 Tax=Acipenser ruthenus TaxID=7906 RepID=A0A444U870_ACIRT|nr:hypothetical protein EOD39_7110 [Acipenser ruthenus]